MQETPVRFLGWEDPLEKGQATHSSILGLPLWLSSSRIRLQCWKPGFDPWVGKIPWSRDRLPTPVFMASLEEYRCNVRDWRPIPGLGRSPGGGHGNPLQHSCLENPHGQRSLVGYSPWGLKESDMTEQLSTAQHSTYIRTMEDIHVTE